MKDGTNSKIYTTRRMISILVFAVILVFFYYADEKSSKAITTNETLTRWNSDNDTYKKIELDGENNGYILSNEGKICYYQYDQKGTKDLMEETNAIQDDELLESGIIEFDKDYGWTYEKKSYEKGELVDKSIDNNSYKKKKFPFQELLRKGKGKGQRLEVIFYDGSYDMYGPFRNYSYTTITANEDDDVVLNKKNNESLFVNVDDSDEDNESITEYHGSYGFHLKKLTFDLNCKYASVVKAAHAMYYTMEDCKFCDAKAGHVLELNSMRYVTVDNCKFENINYDNSGEKIDASYLEKNSDEDINCYVEAIQIEGDSSQIYKENIPMGRYAWTTTKLSSDNTTSMDIMIKNCEFNGVISGIGHHYYNDENYVYQTDISIENNSFDNVAYNAICLYGYKNANINANTFKTVSSDEVGGSRIFLKNCVDENERPYTNDYIDILSSQNSYYSDRQQENIAISELADDSRQIIINEE